MIAIVNKGKTDKPGVYKYNIYINEKFICSFTHKKSQSLAKCLLLASQAVKEKEMQNITDFIRFMKKGNG